MTQLDKQMRSQIRELQGKRFKSAGDEITIERLQRTLVANPSKWQVGQGVGWRAVRGQANRGYRIERVIPETKEAIIRPVGDIGQLADYTGKPERVDIIDLLRDKRYDRLQPPAPAPNAGGPDKLALEPCEQCGHPTHGVMLFYTGGRGDVRVPWCELGEGHLFDRVSAPLRAENGTASDGGLARWAASSTGK